MNHSLDSKIRKIEEQARADNPDALFHASMLIDEYPDDLRSWLLRSYILECSQNWIPAIEDLSRAIKIAPTEPVLLSNRGECQLMIKRYRDAIDDFSCGLAACNLRSNDYCRELLHFCRAYAHLCLGNKNEALEDLGNVLDDNYRYWLGKVVSKKDLLAECF